MAEECKTCKHERKYHAIKEMHNLRTTHCTKFGCNCGEFLGGDGVNKE